MSYPTYYENDSDDLLLKAKPRRPFELTSPPPSAPSTPPPSKDTFASNLHAPVESMEGTTTPSRTRSFLNLTSSTLFGIYQPTGYSTERDNAATPWGTGAQTPALRTPAESPVSRHAEMDWSRSSVPDAVMSNAQSSTKTRLKSRAPQRAHQVPRRGFKGFVLPILGKTLAMFAIGVSYALLITRLHDRRDVAPVKVALNRESWSYLILWGIAGVFLGEALPWVDTFWAPSDEEDEIAAEVRGRNNRGLDGWMDVVRSVGAFIGIAFAIRKLPWESTLQLSLTLALANPAVWYIVDCTPAGLVQSTVFAVGGTAMLLVIDPALIPSPTPAQVLRGIVTRSGGVNGISNLVEGDDMMLGIFSPESVGVSIWIASTLFVSSVCFGNIGRRLALQKP